MLAVAEIPEYQYHVIGIYYAVAGGMVFSPAVVLKSIPTGYAISLCQKAPSCAFRNTALL
jgi:hypothetical protein